VSELASWKKNLKQKSGKISLYMGFGLSTDVVHKLRSSARCANNRHWVWRASKHQSGYRLWRVCRVRLHLLTRTTCLRSNYTVSWYLDSAYALYGRITGRWSEITTPQSNLQVSLISTYSHQ